MAAARSLGLEIELLRASNDSEVDAAFAALTTVHVGGLLIRADSFLFSRKERLAAPAARYAMPAIFGFREFAAAGGLASYGASPTDARRIVGVYVGRILDGEKPANLPVQQATKVELIINLRAAKTLGLNIPLPLPGRADLAKANRPNEYDAQRQLRPNIERRFWCGWICSVGASLRRANAGVVKANAAVMLPSASKLVRASERGRPTLTHF
jgi:hypothetical protein